MENKTPMPIAKVPAQANVVNGKIYVLGGYPNNTLNEVYDPVADNWTLKASIPIDVYGVSVVYESKIYLIGCYARGDYPYTAPITQVYDPENDTWSKKCAVGPNFVGKSFVAVTSGITAPKRIFVFYNPADAPNSGLYLNQVYDPEKDSWTSGNSFPTSRQDFGVAVVDDFVYVIGGNSITYPNIVDFNQNIVITPHATVEQYTPFGYGAIPPQISVTSPQNMTYFANEVSLIFMVNKIVNWVGYSLDEKENITVTGNVTLSGLSLGQHNVTVYARDGFENTGTSETIPFSVAEPESVEPVSFQINSIAIAIGVSVIVIVVCLLVYLKRRKR